MKKVFTILLLTVIALSVYSQSAQVRLTIRLHPFHEIQVNKSQSHEILDYITKENYRDGVSITKSDHLTVSSSGAFNIHVSSTAMTVNKGKIIKLSTVKIKASNGGYNPLTTSTYSNMPLSTDKKILISSPVGGIQKTFNIKYSGSSGGKYLDKLDNNELTIYDTYITYTVTPK